MLRVRNLMSRIILALFLVGCAAPCESVSVFSAYKAEQEQCIRNNEARVDAVVCINEVRERYQPKFVKMGEEVADFIDKVK